MDDEEEYERARQEQIKQNKDLLASLGLNAQTTRIRSPSPPRPTKAPNRPKRERRSEERSASPRNLPPARERSARVAARGGKTSYVENDFYKQQKRQQQSKVAPRQGTRKSGRLSGDVPANDSKYIEEDSSGTDSDDYVNPQRVQRPRGPPGPPAKVNKRDWDSEQDIFSERMPLPSRNEETGELVFEEAWNYFTPNLTPEEMLRGGAFGGTFFKPHYSTVLQRELDPDEDLAELPAQWLEGIDRETMLTSEEYDATVNKHGKKAGQALSEWEKAGWIIPADPRGWFQWYYRFYLGRRTRDDSRQVSRWAKAVGPTGRFRRTAHTSVASRQICWQWGVNAP